MNVLLAAVAALLFAIGTYLVIQRKLSRIIIGISLLTHGANVLFVLAGRRGDPPIVGSGPSRSFADPLPQAMALTAIVISFGVTAFLLALAYRSWILTSDDEVEDDVTDRLISTGGFEDTELADAGSLRDAEDRGEDDEGDPAGDGADGTGRTTGDGGRGEPAEVGP